MSVSEVDSSKSAQLRILTCSCPFHREQEEKADNISMSRGWWHSGTGTSCWESCCTPEGFWGSGSSTSATPSTVFCLGPSSPSQKVPPTRLSPNTLPSAQWRRVHSLLLLLPLPPLPRYPLNNDSPYPPCSASSFPQSLLLFTQPWVSSMTNNIVPGGEQSTASV